jgi:hypothetical protein
MDKTALDPTGVLREALFEGCLAGRLGLASREAQLLTIALGANGYVVVPEPLLKELLRAAEDVLLSGNALRVESAVAAVVEAVGPTT